MRPALGELFTQVLLLCARAGMGRVGTIAIDGTKIAANAALSANRSESRLRRIAADILAEAAAVDAAEDEQYGPDRRGDELPPQLADPTGRPARIKQMLKDIAAERDAEAAGSEPIRRAADRVERARDALACTRAIGSPNATRSGPTGSSSSAPTVAADYPAGWCRSSSTTTCVKPRLGWPAPKRT